MDDDWTGAGSGGTVCGAMTIRCGRLWGYLAESFGRWPVWCLRHRLVAADRGMSAVEVVLLAPAVMAVMMLLVVVGRLWDAQVAAETAAATAARSASMARTPDAAVVDAQAAVAVVFSDTDSRCPARADRVRVDVSDFRPGGVVTVDIQCHVMLKDVIMVLPATNRVTKRGVSRVEWYKEG